MKFFAYEKDGGKESKVWGLFIAEIKSLFSVVLLHFKDGSREAFHSHAFNSKSLILRGQLNEHMIDGKVNVYKAGQIVTTLREHFHMVKSVGDTFVISFRGPWASTWHEFIPGTGERLTMTHGRKIVARKKGTAVEWAYANEAANGAQ
jgi:quercetin dioxygenase-like cupin family protein